MNGLTFLKIDELIAATRGDVSQHADRVGEYIALRSSDPESDQEARDFLLEVLTEPLADEAIASWVGVHAPDVWDPVLVRCQLKWTEVAFGDRDELLDAVIESHAGDLYAAEVESIDLPLGPAVRVQQILEDATDATDDASDAEALLLEMVSIYIPVGDLTLAVLGNCSSAGWEGTWGPWIDRLALSLRWDSTIASGEAAMRTLEVAR